MSKLSSNTASNLKRINGLFKVMNLIKKHISWQTPLETAITTPVKLNKEEQKSTTPSTRKQRDRALTSSNWPAVITVTAYRSCFQTFNDCNRHRQMKHNLYNLPTYGRTRAWRILIAESGSNGYFSNSQALMDSITILMCSQKPSTVKAFRNMKKMSMAMEKFVHFWLYLLWVVNWFIIDYNFNGVKYLVNCWLQFVWSKIIVE